MKRTLLAVAVAVVLSGCAGTGGLVVTHTPNPSNVYSSPAVTNAPYPYMWFYRTEVKNQTDRPIRITSFEGYFFRDGRWVAANILNRPLTSTDFAEWYRDGAPVRDGWIAPHAVAACDPNWHGVTSPVSPRCKWTYDGLDAGGTKYHAEAEIQTVPNRTK